MDIHSSDDGSLYYLARGTGNTSGVVSRITYTLATPKVDFTANGSDGPVFLSPTQSLQLAISFTAGSGGPLNSAEMYIGLSTPGGLFWVDPVQGLTSTLSRVHVGPVGDFSLSPWLTLGPGALSRGGYTWIILVDDDADGVPSGDFSDFVVTVIDRHCRQCGSIDVRGVDAGSIANVSGDPVVSYKTCCVRAAKWRAA